jgi:GGDEF domain-containing protein
MAQAIPEISSLSSLVAAFPAQATGADGATAPALVGGSREPERRELARRIITGLEVPGWLRTIRETPHDEVARQIEDAIPRLARQLTGLGNLGLLGSTSCVDELSHFLRHLGPVQGRQLAAAIGLVDSMTDGLEFDVQQRLRARTLMMGLVAHEWSLLAGRSSDASPLGYAILQPLGIAVLARQLGPIYQTFFASVAGEQANLRSLEVATLGFDHLDVTDGIFQAWQLNELFHDRDVHRESVGIAEQITEALIDRQSPAFEEFLRHSTTAGWSYHQLHTFAERIEDRLHDVAERLLWPLRDRLNLRQSLTLLHAEREALRSLRGGGADPLATPLAEESEELRSSFLEVDPEPHEFAARLAPITVAAEGITIDQLTAIVANAVHSSRRSRVPLSFALAELDGLEVWRRSLGSEINALTSHIARVVIEACEQQSQVVILEGGRLALIQKGVDRVPAVALGRQVLAAVRRWSDAHGASYVTLSIGVATVGVPARNLDPLSLLQAAQRCLNAAQASGGGSLKSIDIL